MLWLLFLLAVIPLLSCDIWAWKKARPQRGRSQNNLVNSSKGSMRRLVDGMGRTKAAADSSQPSLSKTDLHRVALMRHAPGAGSNPGVASPHVSAQRAAHIGVNRVPMETAKTHDSNVVSAAV